ncbi:MAG TPA: YihY/virulence factor BrkB family protein [Rhizomicrobium sp.]|nr:YihY/virulence factor BrkB family protein [Rhizomicrobium sp.]
MAGIARPPTATEYTDRRRAAAKWTPRLASAGLAALLLALGVGRNRNRARGATPAENKSIAAPRLTAKQFVLELYKRISDDRIVAISAGVTFFLLLAVFPATAAVVSIYGLFADAAKINGDLSSMSSFLPGGAIQIIGEQIKHLAAQSHKALGLTAIGSIAFSLWSANAGMKSLFDALNIVLKEKETRGFIKLNAISLVFTAGTIAFVLLAVGAVILIPAILNSVAWGHALELLVSIARWPLIWALLTLGIALLYRFGPGCNDIPWRWITWGSALAAFGWLIASMAFSWYAANYGSFNKTYGSLGAGIGFMTWIWISMIVILIGEEINEILDARKKPGKEAKAHPLGVEGTASRRVHEGSKLARAA